MSFCKNLNKFAENIKLILWFLHVIRGFFLFQIRNFLQEANGHFAPDITIAHMKFIAKLWECLDKGTTTIQ